MKKSCLIQIVLPSIYWITWEEDAVVKKEVGEPITFFFELGFLVFKKCKASLSCRIQTQWLPLHLATYQQKSKHTLSEEQLESNDLLSGDSWLTEICISGKDMQILILR